MSIRNIIKDIFYSCLTRKQVINHVYKASTGKIMNWDNPRDYNEKINWLKLNSDTSLWTQYADKFRVRKHIEELGLSELLVPLLGKWDKAEDIDFSILPDRFVIKTNHGSGDVIIVKDKQKTDVEEIRHRLKKNLRTPYGKYQGENHYLKIPPCIIAEPLLEPYSSVSSSLIDYKMICFDGKPFSTLCFFNREEGHYEFELHDINWEYQPQYLVYNEHSRRGGGVIPKPISYDKMVEAASILSKGFPQVRIDFYEIDGKPFISELTFTSTGGCICYLTQEYLNILGDQCIL